MKKDLVNEYDLLESVIVHAPGLEHLHVKPNNLDPKNKEGYLLFDDLLYQKKAAYEHSIFTAVIKRFTGEEKCFYLMDLLKDVLEKSQPEEILDFLKDLEQLENNMWPFMDEFVDEIREFTYEAHQTEERDWLSKIYTCVPIIIATLMTRGSRFEPLINTLFTRDLGISIGGSMIITWASNDVRNAENIIAKFIIKNHKLFSDCTIYDFHENHPDLALEGGDVTLINNEAIAIGVSERTSKASVEAITPFLYENDIKYIMCFNMPEERRFMHLDTVFSVINKKEAIVYPPFFEDEYDNELDVDIITTSKKGPLSTETLKVNCAFKKIGINFNFIRCGGKHFQEREQWTDGANAFCLSPGVIILYDRNPDTLLELKKNGYKIISADDFLALKDFDRQIFSIQKTVITIESGELSRGRGGPRCMTMPINRIK